MKLKSRQPRRRRGFTLIEVLLVVAILVALAAIAVPRLLNVRSGAQRDEARIQVRAFQQAVETFQINTGQYPQSLMELFQCPSHLTEKWRGPYIEEPNKLDPWGSPYNYQPQGSRNPSAPHAPDIWSNGADRTPNSADDIGNWPTNLN